MTLYSHLTAKDFDHICSYYNIGKAVSWKPLSGGSENSNYCIYTHDSKYVLSVCEQKTMQEVDQLALLLEHLHDHQYSTSKIFRDKDNNTISLWNGKPVLLKSFIEGEIVENLSPNLLKLIGKELGKLHQIPAPDYLPKTMNYGRQSFKKVQLYAAGSQFEKWIKKIEEYFNPYFDLDIPRTLIHGDVFWNNVIVNKEHSSAVIMDFEEAAYYYRIFDIGMTIIGTCAEGSRIELRKVISLIEGYLSEVNLSQDEVLALKPFTVYAGASMTFWRHINFNYTNPDPNRYEHYRGLMELTDSIFSQNEDFLLKMIQRLT